MKEKFLYKNVEVSRGISQSEGGGGADRPHPPSSPTWFLPMLPSLTHCSYYPSYRVQYILYAARHLLQTLRGANLFTDTAAEVHYTLRLIVNTTDDILFKSFYHSNAKLINFEMLKQFKRLLI